MKKLVAGILAEQNHAMTLQLQERIEKLLPRWESEQVANLAQQIMTVMDIYLIDGKVEAAADYLDKVVNNYFPELKKAPAVVLNAILVSRYILLSLIARNNAGPVNSLEVFGQLNDLYEPLLREVSKRYQPSGEELHELLPQDFQRAENLELLSFDFVGVGIFVLDRQFSIIYWSDGMEKLFGVKSEEVLGKNFSSNCLPLSLEDRICSGIRFAVEKGVHSEIISTRQRSQVNGERYMNFKIAPLRDNAGLVIGASVLIHDVTEHRESKLALKTYEKYFQNILNDAADAIIILDENDRIAMWNKAAEALYGWRAEEVLGQPVTIIVPDDHESQREIEELGRIVREKGYIRKHRSHRLTRFGKKVIIEITRTAIRDDRGRYIGSSVISRDITQEEQLREQLTQSEKLSAVGTLAAGIAHEVGSPLTSISSLAQIMQMETTDEKMKANLALIQQQIDRISRTVRTLVDFSKPIAQKTENIYLNQVIEQVIKIIKYEKRLKHQQIVTQLEARIPLVRASFDQVLQVLINLCLNAADAMEGNKGGRLEIKSWYEKERVFVSISDNGHGIDEKDLPHIFEPFFTTKEEGKGTGLGLWVSYNIVKNYSGDIRVESQKGVGTTFTISFPAMAS